MTFAYTDGYKEASKLDKWFRSSNAVGEKILSTGLAGAVNRKFPMILLRIIPEKQQNQTCHAVSWLQNLPNSRGLLRPYLCRCL